MVAQYSWWIFSREVPKISQWLVVAIIRFCLPCQFTCTFEVGQLSLASGKTWSSIPSAYRPLRDHLNVAWAPGRECAEFSLCDCKAENMHKACVSSSFPSSLRVDGGLCSLLWKPFPAQFASWFFPRCIWLLFGQQCPEFWDIFDSRFGHKLFIPVCMCFSNKLILRCWPLAIQLTFLRQLMGYSTAGRAKIWDPNLSRAFTWIYSAT